jgi:hypothetical protein
MHPWTIAAIIDRLAYSTRISSAMNAVDDSLVFTDSDSRLAVPNTWTGLGYPEAPFDKRRGLYLVPLPLDHVGGDDSQVEEWRGPWMLVALDYRAERLALVVEAVRSEFNEAFGARAYPDPNAFATMAGRSVIIDTLVITTKGELIKPGGDEGYTCWRSEPRGTIRERYTRT